MRILNRKTQIVRMAAVLTVMTLGLEGAWSDDPVEVISETKLPSSGNKFGRSVDISDDSNTILIGAPATNTSDPGQAIVFERSGSTWVEVATLTASDGVPGASLGDPVRISGDTAVLGAHRDDDAGFGTGAAYIFQKSGSIWGEVEVKKLTASDAAGETFFGHGLPIRGDTIVSGAPNDDRVGTNAGAIYIYQDTSGTGNWSSFSEIKITPSDAAAGDEFGRAIAMSDDTIVAGAIIPGDASGVAYVFEDISPAGDWSSFTETKLTAFDAEPNDIFGSDVAISGDTIAVGALLGDADTASDSGAIYIFQRSGSTWVAGPKLTASDAENGDRFGGHTLAIDGATIVTGAPLDDDAGSGSGSAYILRDTSAAGDWSSFSETKVTAGDAAAGDEFGFAVSLSNDTLVVGARFEGGSGGAYVYKLGVSTALAAANIDPANVPTNVLNALVASDNAGTLIQVAANNNTIALAGNALVLTENSFQNGSIEGSGTVVVGSGANVNGNISGDITMFACGAIPVFINGNCFVDELILCPESMVDVNGNLSANLIDLADGAFLNVTGDADFNDDLQLGPNSYFNVGGNLECLSTASANIDATATLLVNGNDNCPATP